MLLDRKIAPEIHSVLNLQYIQPILKIGKNGNRYFVFSGSDAETIRIEAIFNGIAFPNSALEVCYAMDLLTRGTKNKDGYQINQLLDLYGSFFSVDPTKDKSSAVLFTLKKYLPKALPLFAEILSESVFPASELDLLKKSEVNQFKINLKKSSVVADRAFQKNLFGNQHPYGWLSDIEDHENMSRDQVEKIYKERILGGGVLFILSGNISDSEFEEIDQYLSAMGIGDYQSPTQDMYTTPLGGEKKTHHAIKDSVQTSLRVGKIVQIQSPEEMALASVSNVLFGGYFGSRLMSNLREKNGFTYGVGSGYQTMRFAHTWTIRTDVGAEVSEKALHEIFVELDKLQNEIPTEEELLRVKRYLAGNLASRFENIHSLPLNLKNILLKGESPDYFIRMSEAMSEVNAEQVSEFAQRNWNKEELKIVSAGG